MPVEIGTASGHLDLLHRLRHFVCGHGTWSAEPQFTGDGPGAITDIATAPATVTETWTLTCTNADIPGEEIWTVNGSVTGATADATTGTAYDNGLIQFLITGTGYVVGDVFTWDVTQGLMSAAGSAWTLMGADLDDAFDQDYYFRAPGLTGAEEIYVNMAAYQSAANDYYNWKVAGAIGFESTFTFDGQPGRSPDAYTLLWQSETPYWFVANGQRVIVVAKVSTTYQVMYLGKILPYGTPSQFPYPLLIAGTTSNPQARWSSRDTNESVIFNPGLGSYLYVGNVGWREIRNRDGSGGNSSWRSQYLQLFPTHVNGLGKVDDREPDWGGPQIQPAPDGTYTLLPLVPLCTNSGYAGINQFGELDGIYWVTGTANASENIVSVDGVDHLVVQNMNRTNWTEYGAVRLT